MLALAAALAGCSGLPVSGYHYIRGKQQVADQAQSLPQPIPVPPGKGWKPRQIVNGFLAASASAAGDYAIARLYLAPPLNRQWQPTQVRIVAANPNISEVSGYPRQINAGSLGDQAKVRVIGQQIATLSDRGQYQTASSPLSSATFTLNTQDGQWRITGLPSDNLHLLMLTPDDFFNSYQPRNLYFFGPSDRFLVPDPVFVPDHATEAAVAEDLVQALLNNPVGWQANATFTSFPPGTKLLGPVKLDGNSAIVDLGGAAARTSAAQRAQMAAQLAWTLTSSSYAPPLSQSAQIYINGRGPLPIRGNAFQLRQHYRGLVPGPATAPGPYFIGSDGVVSILTGLGQPAAGQSSHPVPGLAGGPGVPAMSAIAVSPDRRYLAGIPRTGGGVYIGALNRQGGLTLTALPGTCTSVSWAPPGSAGAGSPDRLWAVTRDGRIWTLVPGQRSATQVMASPLPSGERVIALRMAPDGVRVAMLVHGPSGNSVALGAVSYDGSSAAIGGTVAIGSGLANPVALTWYGPDDLIVLSRQGAISRLDEVPLNGSQPTPISTDSDMVSITSDGAVLVAGLRNGSLVASTGIDAAWYPTGRTGLMPAYPG